MSSTTVTYNLQSNIKIINKWYYLSGRIGRLQYITYQMLVLTLVYAVWILIVSTEFSIFMTPGKTPGILFFLLLMFVLLSPFTLYLFIIYPRRRLNDLNKSGWRLLMLLVPAVNTMLILYLMLAKGTEGVNQYGCPTKHNRVLHYIIMMTLTIIILIFRSIHIST